MAPVGGVVEISSDEEDFPAGNKLPVGPLGWATGLFDADDDPIGDDFDDLMVLSEWSSPPVLQKTARPDDLVVMSELPSPVALQKKAKSGCGRDDADDFAGLSDDDECVVLDGDPDKAVTVGGEDEESAGDGSSDELQIVAEKGQIACRDFPHSRHSCSNLPFSTTSHAKYCNMCHCFVCDTPAPCKYWGNGTTVADHCHATDKETKWKTLRQAFKCRSLPASGPDKNQNVLYSTVTSTMQPAMQCPVANMGHPSLANQSPLLYDVSQNQQMHPSVRASLSVAGTVSTPRAGRGIGNAHIAQNNHSHAIFKRGAVSPGLATRNANRYGSAAAPDNSLMQQATTRVSQPVQVARRTNAFNGTAQNNHPQRSFSAPIAFQAQEDQPAAHYQIAQNGMTATGQQLSRCSSLIAQRTGCLEEPVIDVSTKSWQDILASVACDLGVPDYDISTAESQQVMTNSGCVHSTASQGLGLQHESVAAAENLASSHVHDLSNHTTGCNIQADGPLQTAESLHSPNCQSSPAPNDVHLNNFVSTPADGLAMEAAHQLEISGLESNILFEFDWS